jgi:cytochrome P450 family 6
MFEIIDAIGDKLVNVVENAAKPCNEIELHEFLACFTTDNISNVAFGLDSNSLENSSSEFRKYGKEVLNLDALGFLKFFFTSSFPELSRKMHLTANKKNVIKFFYSTFKENMERRERSNIERKDFLQILLELKKTASLTVSELAAESFIFFLGGEFASRLIRNCAINRTNF